MSDIGATLREARLRARIDITEVETRTKIRAKYLRAMENEEWDLLPGEVYVKSFLRTYGEFLGLDTRQLVDDYKRRYERPTDHELRPIAPPGRERRPSRGPVIAPWMVIGAVLVAVVVVLYLVGTNSNKAKTAQSSGSRTVVTHPRHRPRHHRTITIPATKPQTVKLQLVPTGALYVCLVDGKGKKLIPGQIFSAGQTIPAQTAPKLLLTLGNAAVRMKVNGRAVHVPGSATSIGFLLTPSANSSLSVAKQPRCT
jgi:cytoskeleton protein RodZ